MSDSTVYDERIFLLNAIELCVAIFRGPSPETWEGIVGSGLPELVSNSPQGMQHLTASLEKLQDSLPNQSEMPQGLSELETEYVRLFIASSGGVAVPLYESCHQDVKPQTMGESALAMRDRLAEAGLAVALESNEPPDHIAIELEYLYHQLSTGWSEIDPELISGGGSFSREVMLPWVTRFRSGLKQAKPHPAYLAAADVTMATLEVAAAL